MGKLLQRWLGATVLAGALMLTAGAAFSAGGGGGSDDPTYRAGSQPLEVPEETEEMLLQQDIAFMSRRIAGTSPLSNEQAGVMRAAAAKTARNLGKQGIGAAGPVTFAGPWAPIGPNPIQQVQRSDNAFGFVSGRIGALAIRPSNGQIILGAAQGGIWLFNDASGTWVPKTDASWPLAIGALAIAPTDDAIVYAGTGEGALSGDSYYGNGVLKSTDGGQTWSHVSGDYFVGVAISRIAVDPTNASHLYATVLRGRGGARRTTPSAHSKYGIWESKDGGVSWTLLKEAKLESNGATDIEIDPQNPSILYASFWGDAMYKSTNGGATWTPIMGGLPSGANFAAAQTRFSISISHPSPGGSGVLYAGFDWIDSAGAHQPARIFKSTNGGASWNELPAGVNDNDSVEDYCGTQCFYDNVVEADPTNPDIVFVGGSFGYDLSPPSGGVFRTTDGGQTWLNLGWDQHPDFHALAFDAANPGGVIVGSDGGVWYSPDRGGRNTAGAPLSANDWISLNGGGLQITQFTSIATNPTLPARFWGGSQDNGTERKSATSQFWFDLASGDGGQVLVDPTDFHYVYGTFFGISPYRFTDGGAAFFTNAPIRNGINGTDRADFYVPWAMNQLNPNQLFLGTYRMYRTDNAKASSAGAVLWKPISPDLTAGCTGIAPNGGRGCVISAVGIGGGTGVYSGSEDGSVYFSPDAQTSDTPTWTRIDQPKLPARPVTSFAVDRSNDRIAYVALAGFNGATPGRPGHLFKTTDAGSTWTDVSGNLPDVPVNSVILDPSFANTLYAGTDVGPMVTYDGGAHWSNLGGGIPPSAVWQLDLDPSHRTLAAGTHGRGAWTMTDATQTPALVLSKVDAGIPVGPSSDLTYTLTLRNIGNASATGVTITDPVPANTTFVSADHSGSNAAGTVTWSGLTVAAGGSVSVSFTVSVADALKKKVSTIVNDGFEATSAEGPFTTGSQTVTRLADPFGVGLSPAAQTGGGHPGGSATYTVSVKNLGFTPDTFTMSSSGGTYPVSFLDPTCTTSLTTTPTVAPGATTDVCVEVDVPGGAASGDSSTSTVTATSVGNPALSASGTVKTIAVTTDTLLVDDDSFCQAGSPCPNMQPVYAAALTAAGVPFTTWDLGADPNLPARFVAAFKNVVWFTANSYPAPISRYEGALKSFLDGGGRLFMSGQDILDQAAGTTAFVHDYLHITWDGSETQNDKATATVKGVSGNPVGDGIGPTAIDHTVLTAAFEDRITPNGGALAAFVDDSNQTDALTFSGSYKVVFLAFPLEAYGTAGDKSALVTKVMSFFGP